MHTVCCIINRKKYLIDFAVDIHTHRVSGSDLMTLTKRKVTLDSNHDAILHIIPDDFWEYWDFLLKLQKCESSDDTLIRIFGRIKVFDLDKAYMSVPALWVYMHFFYLYVAFSR